MVGDGDWRHVVVTYRNGRHQLYVDGNLEGTDFFALGTMIDEPGGLMPMTIGAWTGAGGSFATAAIDDVRLYGGVLPEAEVVALGLDADEDGLSDNFELTHSGLAMLVDSRQVHQSLWADFDQLAAAVGKSNEA